MLLAFLCSPTLLWEGKQLIGSSLRKYCLLKLLQISKIQRNKDIYLEIIICRNGDSLHQDSAHSEDMLGSEYGRGSDYDQAKESIHSSAPTLYNYQSFMDKKPRGKWSKQDTQLFYEVFVEANLHLISYWNSILGVQCLLIKIVIKGAKFDANPVSWVTLRCLN